MNTKIEPHFSDFLPYDYDGIAEHLEKMALKGWELTNIGAWIWTYRKSTPRKLHYQAEFLPFATQYTPEDDEQFCEFRDYCRESGWEWVTSRDKLHIFVSGKADPTPIETDESVKLDLIKKSMRGYLISYFVIALISLFLVWDTLGSDSWTVYAEPVGISWLALIPIFLIYALSLIGYFIWLIRSEKSVREGGGILRSGPYAVIPRILLSLFLPAMLVLYLVLPLATGTTVLDLPFIGFLAGMIISSMLWDLRKHLRKNNVKAEVNMAVNIALAAAVVLTMIAVILFIKVDSDTYDSYIYDLDGAKRTAFVSSDYRDTGGMKYEYEYSYNESFLMGLEKVIEEINEKYWDKAMNNEDPIYDYSYHVAYVDKGFIYEQVRKGMLKDHEKDSPNIELDVPSLAGEYRTVNEPWGAEKVYRYHESGGTIANDWILCYKDKIVYLYLNWGDVDEKDMKALGKIFKSRTREDAKKRV